MSLDENPFMERLRKMPLAVATCAVIGAGLGAVMGAKRLKAIAVRGTRHAAVADPAGVAGAARDLSRRSLGPATAKYRELGTVANLLTFNRLAALPTRNFQQGTFEDAAALSGEELNAARRVARRSCAASWGESASALI